MWDSFDTRFESNCKFVNGVIDNLLMVKFMHYISSGWIQRYKWQFTRRIKKWAARKGTRDIWWFVDTAQRATNEE